MHRKNTAATRSSLQCETTEKPLATGNIAMRWWNHMTGVYMSHLNCYFDMVNLLLFLHYLLELIYNCNECICAPLWSVNFVRLRAKCINLIAHDIFFVVMFVHLRDDNNFVLKKRAFIVHLKAHKTLCYGPFNLYRKNNVLHSK